MVLPGYLGKISGLLIPFRRHVGRFPSNPECLTSWRPHKSTIRAPVVKFWKHEPPPHTLAKSRRDACIARQRRKQSTTNSRGQSTYMDKRFYDVYHAHSRFSCGVWVVRGRLYACSITTNAEYTVSVSYNYNVWASLKAVHTICKWIFDTGSKQLLQRAEELQQ